MSKMRAAQIARPNGPFEIVERDIPQPAPDWVRIKVEACGICHSDSLVKEGHWPGLQYPRVPGHEVVGVVDAVGARVTQWKQGQHVGVGWHGGHCNYCDACRSGEFFGCQVALQTTGISFDGGYADYMTAPAVAVASVPDGMPAVETAPLMCAGITTFNALRNSNARPGDVVAILGLGGLGHLAVQYAAKMGFKTVGIARGQDKEPLARKLGAHHYIDSQTGDPAAELLKLGGARAILATVTNGDAMSAVQGGLGLNGTLMVIGAVPSLQVSSLGLMSGRRSVKGWYSGTAIDSQDTLKFSQLTGVRSLNEVYPLERVDEAYKRMMSGNARFRLCSPPGTRSHSESGAAPPASSRRTPISGKCRAWVRRSWHLSAKMLSVDAVVPKRKLKLPRQAALEPGAGLEVLGPLARRLAPEWTVEEIREPLSPAAEGQTSRAELN